MKRTLLSLLVVGLFAGIGTAAIADDVKAGSEPKANSRAIDDVKTGSEPKANSRAIDDVKAGSEPKANSRAMAPIETDSTAQKPAASTKQTNPAKEDGAAPTKEFAGNSSDQPKYPKN